MLEDMFGDDDFFEEYEDPFKNEDPFKGDGWIGSFEKSIKKKDVFGLEDMFWKAQNGRMYNKNIFAKEIHKKVNKSIENRFNEIFKSFDLTYNNKPISFDLTSYDLVSDPGFSGAKIGLRNPLSFQKYKERELTKTKDLTSRGSIYFQYVEELSVKYNYNKIKILDIMGSDDLKFDSFRESLVITIIDRKMNKDHQKEMGDTINRLRKIFNLDS